MDKITISTLVSALVVLSGVRISYASLGMTEASVEGDRQRFTAERHPSVVKSSYTIHEIANRRITVREYSANGVIFAISWTGARHPDLSGLLGKYFEDYQATSKRAVKVKGIHSYRSLQGQGVVVEKSGHMRWIQGKAYAPALMPEGVSPDEVK